MFQAPKPTGRVRTGNAHSNFGASAGGARLLKYDLGKTMHAMGMSGHISMVLTYGRWGVHGHNYMFKYGVPGWQSTGAVTSVLLAGMGYTGDTYVLDAEGGFGYFAGYTYWQPELILPDIGKTWWYVHRLHYKPYPCCGAFHNAMDCFYDIVEPNNIKAEEIEGIKVYLRGMMNAKPLPPEQLENISACQFSPPYVFSVAAHRIPRGPQWHDKSTVRNPQIVKFMDKVTQASHPDYDKHLAQDPLNALSRCDVVARGKTFTVEREHRRGTLGTEAAPTDEDIMLKFRRNAERILTSDKIDRAVNMLMELEKLDNISRLVRELIS